MLIYGFIVVSCLALVAILANPKLGAALVGLAIFVYPHNYMSKAGLLPWNIGFDDLFICLLFLVVVGRSNLMGRVPLRMGFSLIGILVFLLFWVVAHFSGWRIVPELTPEQVYKPILKGGIYVLFVYVLLHTIDTERDVRRAAWVCILTITVAAFTVVLYRFFPSQLVIFATEYYERQFEFHGGVSRAAGSFMAGNEGCALMAMTAVFSLCMMRWRMSLGLKVLLAVCILVNLAGMQFTQSRTGALALGITLSLMLVFSRSRLGAGVLLGTVVLAVMLRPDVFLAYIERFREAYNPEMGGQWGGNAATRFDLWREYLGAITPQTLLLGQGRFVGTYLHGMHTHSTYVSLLTMLGVGGLMWALWFFGTFAKLTVRLIQRGEQWVECLSSGVFWAMVAWAVSGVSLDMLVTQQPQFLYLFLAVLVERTHAITKDTLGAATVPLGLPARGLQAPYGQRPQPVYPQPGWSGPR